MTSSTSDESSRREFWADQMEQGYDLVQQIMAYEVRECGERFASLHDAVADDEVEILFSKSKIAGELDRVFFIRESLVRDVIAIGREMNRRGWISTVSAGPTCRACCGGPCACAPAAPDAAHDPAADR